MPLPKLDRPPWLPYVSPMAAFLALTSLEGMLPRTAEGVVDPTVYVGAYVLKVLIVSTLMILCRSTWTDLRPRPSAPLLAVSVVLGLAVTALWVTIPSPPIPFITPKEGRVGFDPNALNISLRVLFLSFRFFGLVVMVPLFEELFWRSFLMRWVADQDFEKLPAGSVTPVGAIATSALFALAHPEWAPALITGLVWAGLLWKTRSVAACVVSHMAANLGLGIYVMATGRWIYW